MNAFSIVELAVPPAGATALTWAARGWVAVAAECLRERVGHDDFVEPPEVQVALYANQRHSAKQVLLAVARHDAGAVGAADGGGAAEVAADGSRAGVGAGSPSGSPDDVLGYAQLDLPVLDNTHLAQVEIMVRPGARRHGIGTALWGEVEARVRAGGRTVVATWSVHGQEAGPGEAALVAPTGVGRLAADDVAVRFARRHGFALEQTDRQSTLRLPVDPDRVTGWFTAAEAVAGPDYRLVRWRDVTPRRWLAPMAVLQARMSTDAPSAGMETGEEAWDEQRVRETDAEYAVGGAGYVLTAAEHVPSG